MGRIVSEKDVEEALTFLRDGAHDMGSAKARVVKAGHLLKHIEALEYKLSDAKSAEGKKADARTSERYMEAIKEDAIAAGEFERMKALREAAELVIQSWQTESANYRGMKL